jgi:uncharacterized membrane protein
MTSDERRPGWARHPGVRTGRRLRFGERAADRLWRAAGSWSYLAVVVAAVVLALLLSVRAALLGVGLSALALGEVSLVLMAERRIERNLAEAALYDLDQGRRATAVAEDLRDEVRRLHVDLARIAAKVDRAGPFL